MRRDFGELGPALPELRIHPKRRVFGIYANRTGLRCRRVPLVRPDRIEGPVRLPVHGEAVRKKRDAAGEATGTVQWP